MLLLIAIVTGIWLLLVAFTVMLCSTATRADAESERLLRTYQLRIVRVAARRSPGVLR